MIVASRTEAEIVRANETSEESVWLTKLFRCILGMKSVPVLQVDNSTDVKLAAAKIKAYCHQTLFHERRKEF